jgi:hypothetical protein
MSQFEQQANIKFCQKLGKSPSETFNMMEASAWRRSLIISLILNTFINAMCKNNYQETPWTVS